MKAFPYKSLSGQEWDNGMDLRDYFAAKAMQGFCANISRDLTLNIEHFTKVAYKVADAMMEARNE